MKTSLHVPQQTDNNLFPPGFHNAYFFSVFNALSFQLVLSSPMVLYARSLHASATVLGILTGMMPLLVIFQIPAASYVSRVGYKRFVFAGWGTRVLHIFGMALVPLTGSFLNEGSRLALLLALLFGFNLSRGISSCAWLPWIQSLVPAAVRGHYLARDAACVNVASFMSFLLAALALGGSPQPWQFAVLFGWSGIMGAVSLIFLKRIPDHAAPEERRDVAGSVPWSAMLRHPPFAKLLCTVVTWSVAYGGLSVFTVLYLKTESAMPEGRILLITSVSFLGGWGSLWFLGSRLDGLGSRPVLTFSFTVWVLILAGWMALAGRVLRPGLPLVLALQFLMGLFAALVQMSHTRLAMAIIPQMGRNHFFALFSVLGSVTLGLAPMAWGLLIDAIGPHAATWLGLEWNRYSIFFAFVSGLMAVALILARRLDEPAAASMDALLRDLFIQSPQRVWVRLWPRE